MFNPRTFDNSRPDGFPVLEIVDGTLAAGQPARLFAPLRQSELTGTIAGPVAALTLRQRFRFTSAQFPKPVQAVYRFPLPGDAAVTGVTVIFGEVRISAQLAERADAEQAYQESLEDGRQALLLTREAPDVFTLQVAGIKPDEDVEVETSYVQLAKPEAAGWSLRVPLTTVPRYVRQDERGSSQADGQPLAVLRDPGHRFILSVTFEGADAIASPTHEIEISDLHDRARVRLRAGEILPDRDFVLQWRPRRDARRPLLHLLRHDDAARRDTHILALVAPPSASSDATRLPREVILLIDHSGSMSGPKWEAADWAIQNLLAGLSQDDTFNLGLFHTTTRWFARKPVRGDERTIRQARDFLLQHKDSGGTELGVALEQALQQPRDDDGRARHVVIVTDAQVSDAGRILTLVEHEAGRPDRRRVDVLCIDAAPNSGLANEVSERGGGIARFLTSDPDEDDIASALDEVLAEWTAPVLRNLTLQIDRPGVQAAGRRVTPAPGGHTAIDLGDVPAGRAISAAVRIPEGYGGALSMRLLADGHAIQATELSGDAKLASHPGVAALFGARRILDIELAQTSGIGLDERLKQLGYDPGELPGQNTPGAPPTVYAENARRSATDSLNALLVHESLRYGIACSATAFVATREEAGERVAGTVAVANALAHGWSSELLMPRMAPVSPPMAAPMFFDMASGPVARSMPMAAPSPERLPASRQAPAADGGAPGDLASLDGAPFQVARGLVSRLRGQRTSPASKSRAESMGRPGHAVRYTGRPDLSSGAATLFDSGAVPAWGAGVPRFTRLSVRIAGQDGGAPLDSGLTLELFVDDLTAPRARVRLADLRRQGGERPLNVQHRQGQIVRLVLRDPNAVWRAGAPELLVDLY